MTLKGEPVRVSWLVNIILVPLCAFFIVKTYNTIEDIQSEQNLMKTAHALMQLQMEVNGGIMKQIGTDIRDIRNDLKQQNHQTQTQ